MKLFASIWVLIIMGASCVYGAEYVCIANSGSALVDRNDATIAATNAWVVAVYKTGADNDIDSYNDIVYGATGADDVLVGMYAYFGTTENGCFEGTFSTINGNPPSGFGLQAGDKIYARVFDSAVISNASWCAVIDDSLSTVPEYSYPPGIGWVYDPGNLSSSDWNEILQNDAPSVTVTSPTNGASFTAPANIIIQANAADTDGTVTQVVFYSGLDVLGTDSTSPYSYEWNNVSTGVYSLGARALDNLGLGSTSAPVGITVGQAPPAAPADVLAGDGTYSDKVRVTWTESTGATGYEVWRNTSDSSGSASKLSDETSTSYDDTSAELEVIYYYWVKAKNSNGTSGFSASDSGYSHLPAPTGVSASDEVYTDKVRVTWAASTGATGYQVWRNTSDSSGSASKMVDTSDTSDIADPLWWDDTSAEIEVMYYYWVRATNSLGTSEFSTGDSGRRRNAASSDNADSDLDGDGLVDLTVYHEASGYWHILLSASGEVSSQKFGAPGYSPEPGDFDGDGRTDMAVYEESSGYWYILPSSTYSLSYQKFGASGYTPVLGDYDGDGKTDLAVYKELSGYWFILPSTTYSLSYQKLGASGYSPVPGDYDGDGKTDMAVYHEATGYWYILKSSSYELAYMKFGASGYNPAPADYDGDGQADVAVYHESSGYWWIWLSASNTLSYQKLGEFGYRPVPGDYDGDGKSDLAVYHEETGYWYIFRSSDYTLYYVQFGGPGYESVGAAR